MKLVQIKTPAGLFLVGILILLGSSCNYPTQRQPTSTPDILPTLVATLLATPVSGTASAMPETPPRLLTICINSEPESLFPFGDNSFEARAVRAALFDGPVDFVNFSPQPVILEEIPTLAGGDVSFEPVDVSPGEAIVDAQGNLTTLQDGSQYLPAGCREGGCAAAYSQAGTTVAAPIQMDQLTVRYRLRDGLLWSDGIPLKAGDSAYAYDIARQLFPSVRPDIVRMTGSYKALDEHTVEWRGIPGYVDPDYMSNFFLPLPEHAWGELPARELASAQVSSKEPIGWGPYRLEEWTPSDHITLVKNDQYFRAGEGLPAFDRLVYRFVGNSREGLAAVQAGECDLLDTSVLEDADPGELAELESTGKIRLVEQPATAWEQLLLNIQPIDPSQPAYFGLKATRQAILQCIDRQNLAASLGLAQDHWMDSYLPATHPLYDVTIEKLSYDPQAGASSLESAGWLDADNDPSTPRVSHSVASVPDGTPFTVELVILEDEERQAAAQVLQDSLAACGIQVNVRPLPQEELFAPGPAGPIFGRSYQMALFGWDASIQPPCQLYTTGEIPGPYPEHPKGWGGANAGGFASAEFDAACRQASGSLSEEAGHVAAHSLAQVIFAEEVPSVPLYTHSRYIATRPDLCGLEPDGSTQNLLWNLEAINYGDGCPGS